MSLPISALIVVVVAGSACALKATDLDPFGRACASAADCAATDACVDLGQGLVCAPAQGGGEVADAGATDLRCTTTADCGTGEGCVQLENGSFCAAADGSGLRVEFGALNGVPRLSGRTTSGLVLRNGGLVAKPWVTGRAASGLTVIGGDLR